MNNEQTKAAVAEFQRKARLDGEAAWSISKGIHDCELNAPLIKEARELLNEDLHALQDKYRRHWRYGWENAMAEAVRRFVFQGA